MSLIRWRRIPDLPSMLDRMQNMMGDMVSDVPKGLESWRGEGGYFGPAVDMYETDTDVVMKAELPGVDRENIEVNAHSDSITVSGESKHEDEVEEKGYYRRELRYGKFSRTLPTPANIDPGGVKARLSDGILTITAPKVEPEEKGKAVEVE
ncbi:MAG: Hsp20/alpha crystallin family protein [Armatimonadota bacterium]